MAELYTTLGTYVPDNLFAGNDVPVVIKAVTLREDQGILKRGTVLGIVTADGLAVPVDSSKNDGSEKADCILVQDTDTRSGDIVVEAYVSGRFNRAALIFGGDDTAEKHETRLRELGIFLSDNISY